MFKGITGKTDCIVNVCQNFKIGSLTVRYTTVYTLYIDTVQKVPLTLTPPRQFFDVFSFGLAAPCYYRSNIC